MTTAAAEKCDMCGAHETVPVPVKDPAKVSLRWCPNCDNPNGKIPQLP